MTKLIVLKLCCWKIFVAKLLLERLFLLKLVCLKIFVSKLLLLLKGGNDEADVVKALLLLLSFSS